LAGGGPENVFLVVNRESPASLCVANHYVALRQIPPGNVLMLSWEPNRQTTDVETFRREILKPALLAIDQRRLSSHIDYLVYSADFPTAISLAKDVEYFKTLLAQPPRPGPERLGTAPEPKPGGEKPAPPTWPKFLTATGAITGLTYLYQAVIADPPGYYLDLHANYYAFRDMPGQKEVDTIGFQSAPGYGPRRETAAVGGRRYLLSVMLGVTAGRGNSLAEVLACLERSAAADGTHPKGTIYFMENNDVRSKARASLFPLAVEKLRELNIAAEITRGTVPIGKSDVQGAVIGAAQFDWKSTGSTILPGAICEHFTSFGGAMEATAGQTPLSEFIRHGAAGASGTVTEPYAIPPKFPSPLIQVHYARGCTLAEAFYQSVASPYQLLIVGDPLCRPWANIPQVAVEGVSPGAVVKGELLLRPRATVARGGKIERFELFVDETRLAACGPDGTLRLDTTSLSDGYHELRVVAIEASPIRSQGRAIIPISTANHGRHIEAARLPAGNIRRGDTLTVTAKSPGSLGMLVFHHAQLVGKIAGAEGRVEIDPTKLGRGPVMLRVVGLGEGSAVQNVWAPPLRLEVE
jgi:hypothetical protein